MRDNQIFKDREEYVDTILNKFTENLNTSIATIKQKYSESDTSNFLNIVSYFALDIHNVHNNSIFTGISLNKKSFHYYSSDINWVIIQYLIIASISIILLIFFATILINNIIQNRLKHNLPMIEI